MRNNILFIITLMFLTMLVACTQGNLGTDVGNPLPDEGDVLLPVKRHAGFCFVFDLEPGMEWKDVGDSKALVHDGDFGVLLDFDDVRMEYKDQLIIGVPEAMESQDKRVLMKYAGDGFAYDESWDFPTVVMDYGSQREIVHLNPRARMVVTMEGDKSFVSNIGVSLDLSKEECLWVSETPRDGELPKSPEPPDFDVPTLIKPPPDVPKVEGGQFRLEDFTLQKAGIKAEPERLKIKKDYRLVPKSLNSVDDGN